jgi:hypothetical protein
MRNEMLEKLQKEYDAMVKLAFACDWNVTPAFQAELMRLTKVVKGLGGRV